jgi:PAS domain S-box-containing protein
VIWAEVDVSAVRDSEGALLHLVVQTQDITARRAAEEALREAQQRLRMTVDLAGMGISEVALDGRFLRVNPALCRITGYSEAELTGMSGLDITPPGEVDESRMRMARAAAGDGDRYTLEKRYLHKDGHVVWVELTAALARDAAGKPAYFVSITQDISQRKETEHALRAGEARYRSVVDALAEGVLLSSADGTVLTYNPAARAIFGADFDELLRRGPRSAVLRLFDESGQPIPVHERPSAIALRSGHPVLHRVARIVRTDGSQAWLRITAVPLQRPAAAPEILLVLSDVTAERLGAAALADSESRYRSVIETMTEAILLMDSQGRVIGSNRAAVRVFGIDLEEVANAGPFSPKLRLFRPDGSEVPTEERPSYQVLKSGTPVVDAIYPATRPDGTHLWVHINATSLSFAPGAPPGAVVTLADITARVEAERALKTLTETLERRVSERTAELSQLNRELESFSYSVSHDLRAPLRAISGFSSLLAEDESERLSPEGLNLLGRISNNAERMGELIDDVLEYSRVTRIDRKLEMVDMEAIAADVAGRLAAPYPGTQVWIGPLGPARADVAMVRQIFENLIGNAFKYSAKADAPAIRVETEAREGLVWYVVSDNGVGFDMRYADRLFGMFQRMHPSADFAGTGVGLAIVKRLVERHGGKIEASAVPGEGATFRFRLGPLDTGDTG